MIQVRKKQCPSDLQVVFVGEKWTPIYDECLKYLDSPVVCFTAYLEAALFSRIKPKIYILPPTSKANKLKGIIF